MPGSLIDVEEDYSDLFGEDGWSTGEGGFIEEFDEPLLEGRPLRIGPKMGDPLEPLYTSIRRGNDIDSY